MEHRGPVQAGGGDGAAPEPGRRPLLVHTEEVLHGSTIERGGVKHSAERCGLCCTHGQFVDDDCPQCPSRWRQMVDAVDRGGLHTDPLVGVLWNLSRLKETERPELPLARIIRLCERAVGCEWRPEPYMSSEYVFSGVWTTLKVFVINASDPKSDRPDEKAWMILGDWCASWLRSITESDQAKAHTSDAHCPTCYGECAGDTP